ncbi:hypothetical protein cyc_04509 [Cyclospora cayetanensis]|uniref:Uncharacterized protein n=1 Tax=Cyclospora cayetanensis TaxID=88456 RepID=A0A1D3D2R1_9EIME|nr:hypothetical protein cyc_04509 [Cyclospora cayetanensis]
MELESTGDANGYECLAGNRLYSPPTFSAPESYSKPPLHGLKSLRAWLYCIPTPLLPYSGGGLWEQGSGCEALEGDQYPTEGLDHAGN